MATRRDNLIGSTWQRQDIWPEKIRGSEYERLSALLEGRADDEVINVTHLTVGILRELLAPHAPQAGRDGASIRDGARRVTYRVTLTDPPERRLRTLEIIPDDGVHESAVFRPPLAALRELAAEVIAEREAGYIVIGATLVDNERRVPSAEELRQLLRLGWGRQRIAEEFGRSPDAVSQWLRRARAERPDLDWPARTRGPAPRRLDAAASRRDRSNE